MDYLLKASAILGIFYIFYKLILQTETFFQSNRLFLLIGILASLLLPLLVIPIYVEQNSNVINDFIITEGNAVNEIQKTIDWTQILLLIYISGVLFFGGKFILSLISLSKLLISSTKEKVGDFYFIKSDKEASPFSFFNYIVYNQESFKQQELLQIITHEKVHAYQWHSFDVLLSQITTIIFWFNPFSWLYKKELQQNLEFIADAVSQEKTACGKSYQQLLLKTSISKNQLALTNNFYNSLIKKRILMLHKNRSKKTNQWKFALIFPLIIAFIFTFNTKVIAQKSAKKEHKIHVVEENVQMVIITKGASDESLEKIKNNFSKEGVTLKFKGIKRNNAGEITAIKIDVSSKQANANFNSNSDDPIKPIKISMNKEGGNISIGNSNMQNVKDYSFVSNDGKHTIHSNSKGTQSFVFISDDENGKHEEHKIIEIKGDGDNVFVIKNGDTEEIHEIKGGDEHQVIEIITSGGDTKSVWVTKKGTKTVDIIKGDGRKNMIFISESDKSPIYFIDGKESTKEDLEKLGADKIDKIEVLKGDSAIEKYGEKAKDGVILISTKKK